MFDLQSLATLATARALEMGSQEGSSAGSEQHFPARKILNLRRKCSWTPRNEPVSLQLQCTVVNIKILKKNVFYLKISKLFLMLKITTNGVYFRCARPKVAWKQWTVLSLQCV